MTNGIGADTNRMLLAAAGAALIGAFFFDWTGSMSGHEIAKGRTGLSLASLYYAIPVMGLILAAVAVPGPSLLRHVAGLVGLATLGLVTYLWGDQYLKVTKWGFHLELAGATSILLMLLFQVPGKWFVAPGLVLLIAFFAPWAVLPKGDGMPVVQSGLDIALAAPFNGVVDGCVWLTPALGASLAGLSLTRSSWGALNALAAAAAVLGPSLYYPAELMIKHGQIGMFVTAGAGALAMVMAPTRGT